MLILRMPQMATLMLLVTLVYAVNTDVLRSRDDRHIYIYTHIYIYICIPLCMYVCMYVCM